MAKSALEIGNYYITKNCLIIKIKPHVVLFFVHLYFTYYLSFYRQIIKIKRLFTAINQNSILLLACVLLTISASSADD